MYGFILAGCGSAPLKVTPHGKSFIVNLGARFEIFWEKAKGKPFEEQLPIWEEYVEGKYTELFNTAIWHKGSDGWYTRRINRLSIAFNLYEYYSDMIIDVYKNFETEMIESITDFKKKYPEANLESHIYILPFGLDAKIAYVTRTQYKNIPDKKVTLLLVGADMVSFSQTSNRKYIYAHELAHVYHFNRQKNHVFEGQYAKQINTLLYQLAVEGIAETMAKSIYTDKEHRSFLTDIKNKIMKEKGKNNVKNLINTLNSISRPKTCENLTKESAKRVNPYQCFDVYKYGHIIVKNLLKHHSLKDLTLLELKKIQRLVGAELKKARSKELKELYKRSPLFEPVKVKRK